MLPFGVLLDRSKWKREWIIFNSSMRKSVDSHKGAKECGAEGFMGFLSTPYQIMTRTSKDGEEWHEEENTQGLFWAYITQAMNE